MKLIPLHNGSLAIVDDADYDRLAQFRWTNHGHTKSAARTTYASRSAATSNGRRAILMHREIMGAKPGQEIDHIDGNGLNNQRANLRFVTSSQNHVARNKKLPVSGYKGVSRHPRTPNRWRAVIALGTFDSAEAAARTYDDFAALLWGEFARPNFPYLVVVERPPDLPIDDERREDAA